MACCLRQDAEAKLEEAQDEIHGNNSSWSTDVLDFVDWVLTSSEWEAYRDKTYHSAGPRELRKATHWLEAAYPDVIVHSNIQQGPVTVHLALTQPSWNAVRKVSVQKEKFCH